MESSTHSIEVNAPLSAVFNQWTQFEEFPHFMEGIEEVRQEAEKFDILWWADLISWSLKISFVQWSAQMGRDHGRAEAEKLVQQGLDRFGLSETDLESLPGSDPRKVAIAGFIHQSTTTPQGWTAERLQMKSAANVSQLLSRAKKTAQPKIKPAKPAI
jgi:hypothetical protein